MRRKEKTVQGAFITLDAKRALVREAERQGIKPATLASEILEKEAKKIKRKELFHEMEE